MALESGVSRLATKLIDRYGNDTPAQVETMIRLSGHRSRAVWQQILETVRMRLVTPPQG